MYKMLKSQSAKKPQIYKMDKEMVLVYISYATGDSEIFKISKFAEELTKYPEIKDALYWEEDMVIDIYKYMNENLKQCDILILFCSQNAKKSEAVEMEWMTALKKRKIIIPIFTNEEDIPFLLSTKLGCKFNERKIEELVIKIYNRIRKLLKKKFKLK